MQPSIPGKKNNNTCCFTHINIHAAALQAQNQRALERSPETEDFKEFPFFIPLCTTGDTWEV